MHTRDAAKQPNFLLVVTDQQRADYLGCYGHPILRTPHIDSLAEKGTRYDRCYVASPACMPNRASLVTGRMPSAHRSRANGIPLSMCENTFVDLLRRDGYRTALIGKSHLQNMIDLPPLVPRAVHMGRLRFPPPGAEEAHYNCAGEDYRQELPERWRANQPLKIKTPYYGFEEVVLCTGHGDNVGGHYYQWLIGQGYELDRMRGPENGLPNDYVCPQAWRTRLPEQLYPTRYIEDQTTGFLKAHFCREDARPFFLMMSFPDPHHPFTPPGRYWDMYAPSSMSVPQSFHCPDDSLPQVQWARTQRSLNSASSKGYGAFAVTAREAQEAMALTCGMISMIDDSVGAVLSCLRDMSALDDTVVIFTSDHGDLLGDHGLLLKGPVHFQSLIRVPLIWRDTSDRFKKEHSATLCSTIDISATILERAGLAPYNGLQGHSLRTSRPQSSRSILVEEDAQQMQLGFEVVPRIRTLVNQRYRLSIYGGTGHGELFDLHDDPHELNNRWQDPAHQSIRAQLFEELALTMIESADNSPYPVYLA